MKKIELNKLLFILAAVLGLVAVFMMFAPAVKVTDGDTTYAGTKVVFGYTAETKVLGATISAEIFGFSFMNFLTYIILVVAIVLALVSTFLPGKHSGVMGIVAIVCFFVAGIFFFCTKAFVVAGDDAKTVLGYTGGSIQDNLSLAGGAIAAAILSLLAGCCAVAPSVIAFVKKHK